MKTETKQTLHEAIESLHESVDEMVAAHIRAGLALPDAIAEARGFINKRLSMLVNQSTKAKGQ